jgi:predicted metal-dependent HD superfamily phosphohydrolase
VIALKPTTGNAGAVGELVELVVGGVADEVAPLLSPPPPPGFVDQNCHAVTLPRFARRWHTGTMSEHDLELEVAWQRHVSTDRALLDRLLARHREKHRRYHTVTHVAWVIRHIGELAVTEPIEHLHEIVAAGFYHDAVYEPSYPANERASARLARRDLVSMGWDGDAVERVGSMIEATEHGSAVDDVGGDTAVLLDADLAILGADPAAYSAYVTAVRAEYRHIADPDWREGRTAVLAGFLERPTIFRTPTGRDHWEDRARANIAAERAALV